MIKLQILSVAICFMPTSTYVCGGGLRANMERNMDNLKQDDALNEKCLQKTTGSSCSSQRKSKNYLLEETAFQVKRLS